VALEEIVCLGKWSDGERHALVTALPVCIFVLPQPHIIDHGVALKKVCEAPLEKVAPGIGFDKTARSRQRFRW